MRAVEVKIHDFRSISETVIRLEPHSLSTGANNSNESNFTDAIRLLNRLVPFFERFLGVSPNGDDDD